MTTYFPYSQIITFLEEATVKHPYFSGWSVAGTETEHVEPATVAVAAEIYY